MKARPVLICAVCAVLGCVSSLQATVIIETVPVGNPGNAADYTGYGAVDYTYNIGKYEVTNGQYIEFLNAIAKTDTYGVYGGASRGIRRAGTAGNYTYAATDGDTNWLNRPVDGVSFWDGCRFANWLENGQPVGSQDGTTTEDGAYTLNGHIGGDQILRNPGVRFALPTGDEWYKAGYYDPSLSSGGGDYWDYPTGSDVRPDNNPPVQDTGNSANFYWDSHYAVGAPYYTTEVGAYSNSPSLLGTFDQGGNVWEWTEQVEMDGNIANRYHWGGSLSYLGSGDYLRSDACYAVHPATRWNDSGFRIMVIPGPATLGVLLVGGLALLRRRRGA